jgi:Siphovirus ReqiPepy6 Gp37-like protein
MAAEQYIELRSFTTGARLAIITGSTGSGAAARNGFRRVTCTRQVNAPGLLKLELPGDYPGLWSLADKTQVILFRRHVARGIAWYKEFVGLYRDADYRNQQGLKTVTLLCPGLMSILGWYHVLWPANVANRTAFTAAKGETIMKTLTDRNAVAANATAAAGRDRDAPSYGVAIEADGAHGNTIDWTANRSHTLLEELQALALVAGGDFSLDYTSSTVRTLAWHTGQLGSDKTATITFSEQLGNMDNVRFQRLRSSERTVALVAGTGQEAARATTVRTGANYASGNDIELFVDGKTLNPDTSAARSALGDKKLADVESRDVFTFGVVQTQGIYYGPSGAGSYTLGDLVGAVKPDGTTVTQQVYRVDLDYTPQDGEQVAIGGRTP